MSERMTATQKAELALSQANEAVRLNAETNALMRELHDALMKPHSGFGNRALLSCVSDLVVEAQSGKMVGARLIFYAKVLGALSVIGGSVAAAASWGGVR
jgi:hypothetical protein